MLSDYLTRINLLVPGGTDLPIQEAEKILAIDIAVGIFSKTDPYIVCEDIDGEDDIFDYALADLESWDDKMSQIVSIEYPIDDDDPADTTIDEHDYKIYKTPNGDVIRFTEAIETGKVFRINYTAKHTVDEGEDTIENEADQKAVSTLAASILCYMLSAYYAQVSDSTIDADNVDHKSISYEYAQKSKMYMALYNRMIGADENGIKATGKTANWETQRLSHYWRQFS